MFFPSGAMRQRLGSYFNRRLLASHLNRLMWPSASHIGSESSRCGSRRDARAPTHSALGYIRRMRALAAGGVLMVATACTHLGSSGYTTGPELAPTTTHVVISATRDPSG